MFNSFFPWVYTHVCQGKKKLLNAAHVTLVAAAGILFF